jgi:predicted nucleic acid binding AN1-type Zn finger protein
MAKTKCDYEDETTGKCTAQCAMIIGDCKFCQRRFCGKHRLPESHVCPNIGACQNEQFERNKKALLSNTCVGKKLDKA